jgi:alpha-L-rhamnosidase
MPTYLRPLLILLALLFCAAPAAYSARERKPEPPVARPLAGRTWLGKWIWTPGEPAPRNSYTYFRSRFNLDRVPKKDARVILTADSRYQLFVNGVRAGHGPVRSDRRWLYYDTWDVTAQLRKGRNVVAVLVHHYGETTFQYMQGRGGLVADVLGPDDRPLAQTGADWKALRSEAWASGGPRMSIQLGFSETYDAAKEPVGWKTADFDDGTWPNAVEIGAAGMEPWPHLVARDIPPMAEEPVEARKVLAVGEIAATLDGSPQPRPVSQQMAQGEREPLRSSTVEAPDSVIQTDGAGAKVRTSEGRRVSFLIDFGREVTGYPRFRVRGAHGGEIVDMGYGEVLHDAKGGYLPQASAEIGTLNPDRDGVHYADRYTCRAGDQQYQTFDKRAFRYMQVDVRNAPEGITLDNVSLLFSTFPVQNRGAFRSSDERLNRIWEIGRYTCQLNMEDAYTDCPWRERGQWWGDARVEGLINYYAFGDTTLIAKALRQHGQSLNEEGATWGVYPTDWDGGRLPSFTLIWMSTLWDYYQHTGDATLVKELFPKVRYSLDHFFAPKVSAHGLLKDVPYWVFIDWAPVETAGEGGALNAYYYDALRRAEQMARLVGDGSEATYRKRADDVKAALNTRLWDAEAHAYRDSIRPDGTLSPKFSQQTNSLCVLFDITPTGENARVLDFIYAPENKPRVVEAGSPYFSYYLLAALYHAGRHEQALAYVREKWGRMLDWGATTWWEMWEPGASFCHGWSGGPTYDLQAHVLGIQPLKPGFAEVSVAPRWLGMSYASGVVPTVNGDVRVAWQRDEKAHTAALSVETERDIPVEITLPEGGTVRINKQSGLPKGVTRLDSAPGTTRIRVERGGSTLLEVAGR